MTADRSAWALPPVTPLTALGSLGEQIATNNGQSSAVTRVSTPGSGPDLLFKRYKKPLDDTDADRLDRLVAFGRSDAAAGRPSREVLLSRTSWPVARVTDDTSATIGCLIPTAPDAFALPGGGFREIDTLARSDERFARNGTPPTPEQRLTACRCLVGIAAALEERKLVYSDWNYANAFWNPGDYSVYLIDMDGCAQHTGDDVYQPGWEDPLAPPGTPADLHTDRYRVALLTARCLTGTRNLAEVLHTLADPPAGVPRGAADLLLDMLWAQDRDRRPRSSALLAALDDGPLVRSPVARSPLPARPAVRRGDTTQQPRQTALTRTGKPATGTQPKQPQQPERSKENVTWALVALFVTVLLIVIIAANAS
ncbi:hypothetical protein J7F01_34895 [Streptomyces sp. ISL-22]|uniref:hypothetical protein n=1 Tax=unclassified Streptomyces TaxID=2593676 RepID=UPI001BEB946E|nr:MULTISPECIES: hypothetical protein [unclassified Streptomyces]MBT2417561.1 hypothetical protein [Streptomyces sp. ISL-24]MBT2437258.1 hypothetical protein [Streptomyces sp. ISL-22]